MYENSHEVTLRTPFMTGRNKRFLEFYLWDLK